MVKKYQKILLGIMAFSLSLGLISYKSKLSLYSRLLFLASSGSYLIFSVKPWCNKKAERVYKQELERHNDSLRSQLLVLHQGKHISLRELRIAKKLKETFTQRRTLLAQVEVFHKQKYSSLLENNLKQNLTVCCEERQALSIGSVKLEDLQKLESALQQARQDKLLCEKEIKGLKQLSNQIALEAEAEAEIIATEIKAAAAAEAEEMKRRTRESLHNTIVEPDKIAHQELLKQHEQERQEVIAEIERLQKISQQVDVEIAEKIKITEATITEKKKLAGEEYKRIKKELTEQAQQQFEAELNKMQDVLEQLNNQIKHLESENQMLRSELKSLDLPRLPEGCSFQEIYAKGLIEFYRILGIKLDYDSAFKEGDKLRIRVVPREKKVGEQQLRTYSDRLQREMKLTELPDIATVEGTIQFLIKLVEIQQLIPTPNTQHPIPNSQYPTSNTQLLTPELVHPEISTEQAREFLQQREYQNFQPPERRFNPKEPITQTERDWVLWLWNFCKIQDQNTILRTVWKNSRGSGVKPGAGSIYRSARERLHQILDEAGLDRRENS